VLANFRQSWGTMMFSAFYSVFYLYEGEGDVLIARAERSTFLNSELKWFAAVDGQDCDDSEGHNNCVLLALDEYQMRWQFLACAGYPWNFAWVNMPLNPAHRMAIQVQFFHSLLFQRQRLNCIMRRSHPRAPQIASIEKDYMLHHHKGSSCHSFYWTGIFLLLIIGLILLIFLPGCVQKLCEQPRLSSSSPPGESLPLLP
jgi:hypothetical protein